MQTFALGARRTNWGKEMTDKRMTDERLAEIDSDRVWDHPTHEPPDILRGCYAGELFQALKAERGKVAELSAAIRNFQSGDYPHPRSYRPDRCPHEQYYYEHCPNCDDEYWASVMPEEET